MKVTNDQRKAVTAVEGNYLVHAGSGAGKTSSYVARISHLIKGGYALPPEILGLTFTNEAAENMKDKLSKHLSKDQVDMVNLSTFHSFAYRVLKQYYPNLYKGRSLMKQWWRIKTLWDIRKKYKLDMDGGALGGFISYQKTNMVKEGMEIINCEKFTNAFDTKEDLQKAFDEYCKDVRMSRLYEFDDMIVDLYYKLKEDSHLLEGLTSQFKYIMVDEFQDTNTANIEILKLITDNNLFVVGDFRQGIYGFINADIENILNFTEEFENVNLIELNENFRSTDEIVRFANNIINSAPVESYKKFSPQVAARGVKGDKIKITMYDNEYSEVDDIIDQILKISNEESIDYPSFAILLRTNTQLGIYESAFANHDIPVDVSTSKSFFDRKEIADILSYARHTINQEDDASITRIANSPNRYIKRDSLKKVTEYAYNKDITFEEACREYNGVQSTNFRGIASVFDHLRGEVDELTADKFLQLIVKTTGYMSHINKSAATVQEIDLKTDAIDKLINMAKMRNFKNIESFLGHISLIEQNSKKSNNGVKIMTVHASKGLEFPTVFVPSVSADNYPHDMNPDVEEERRLFYVACTRAKDHMYISSPVFSKSESGDAFDSSPFLVDLLGDNLFNLRRKIRNDQLPLATMVYN